MKQLALSNGDLIAGPHGHTTIDGPARVRQDLALWFGEEVGTDRFHPDYGSILIRFIGRQPTEALRLSVDSEVSRILSAYISMHADTIQQDYLQTRRSTMNAADVVTGIVTVDSSVELDSLTIRAQVRLASGQAINITRTVTT